MRLTLTFGPIMLLDLRVLEVDNDDAGEAEQPDASSVDVYQERAGGEVEPVGFTGTVRT